MVELRDDVPADVALLIHRVQEQRNKVQALQDQWHNLSNQIGQERKVLYKLESELEVKQHGNQ